MSGVSGPQPAGNIPFMACFTKLTLTAKRSNMYGKPKNRAAGLSADPAEECPLCQAVMRRPRVAQRFAGSPGWFLEMCAPTRISYLLKQYTSLHGAARQVRQCLSEARSRICTTSSLQFKRHLLGTSRLQRSPSAYGARWSLKPWEEPHRSKSWLRACWRKMSTTAMLQFLTPVDD
ncbi:hypothetical protein Bbelb_016360 [Branchiostoma belcheri]|nr:hypothetical protein Bbelb_016360 [Branchiostoma belcheri]